MKTNHSPDVKAKLVIEVLRGEETINEIASKNNVHPTLLGRWKTQAISGLPMVFESETAKARKKSKEDEKEKEALYRQIGILATQNEWLKKKYNR